MGHMLFTNNGSNEAVRLHRMLPGDARVFLQRTEPRRGVAGCMHRSQHTSQDLLSALWVVAIIRQPSAAI